MLPPIGEAQKLHGRVKVLEEACDILEGLNERADWDLLCAVKVDAVGRT
jgi:hypothetical protein